jgi:hypothetical protein
MEVKKLLVDAFLLAIIEEVRKRGARNTIVWIETIAARLGEREGPGLEGDPMGGVNGLPICPFFNLVTEFTEKCGGEPPEFKELVDTSKNMAVSNIFCIFHHRLRAKRAEQAGKSQALHLASNANAQGETVYDEDAIVRAGLSKTEVDELMKKATCVFKFQ